MTGRRRVGSRLWRSAATWSGNSKIGDPQGAATLLKRRFIASSGNRKWPISALGSNIC